VTGRIKVKLWASSSAIDTDFVTRLKDAHPDEYAQNITDGIIRAHFRKAAEGKAPSLVEPGKYWIFLSSIPIQRLKNQFEDRFTCLGSKERYFVLELIHLATMDKVVVAKINLLKEY
jgi:hypothetical protein